MDVFYDILHYLGLFLILLGSIFLFLGALGIYRMPDLYNRLQAGTKASTLGAMSTITGVGLIHPQWFVKLFIIVLFIAFSNPLSSHALARASYRRGVKPFLKEGGTDAYAEKVAEEEKAEPNKKA
jgi:multicomponent Na+:H+ antiporter subunit G